MRDWLFKPLLIVLAIVIVLAVLSIWWLQTGPSPADAVERPPPTPYHQRLQRAMRQLEVAH